MRGDRLDLEDIGFGPLDKDPSPHHTRTFRMDQWEKFVPELVLYDRAVKDWQKFILSNPGFHKHLKQAQEKAAAPFNLGYGWARSKSVGSSID
jgi:hypothetical protein